MRMQRAKGVFIPVGAAAAVGAGAGIVTVGVGVEIEATHGRTHGVGVHV